MSDKPYMAVDGKRFAMKDGPTSTVFGVLGMVKANRPMRILGGVIQNTKASAPVPKEMVMSEKKAMAHHLQTERHILGAPPKTHISGFHYGQVPYPGRYMGEKGKEL
jgi:hypothetical protein